jgi:hypothetical protein
MGLGLLLIFRKNQVLALNSSLIIISKFLTKLHSQSHKFLGIGGYW